MDEREVISGNRDPLVEFSDTMFQWYLSHQSAQTAPKGPTRNGPSAETPENQTRLDSSPYWIIHVLDSTEHLPGARRLQRANIRPLKTDEHMWKSVVMVTDASGLPLGFEVLPSDWHWYWDKIKSKKCAQIICTILKVVQRCTEAPMCGGPPRRPGRLKTTDRLIHRLFSHFSDSCNNLQRSLPIPAFDQLSPKLNQEWARGLGLHWPPVYYCNACKTKSFPTRLKECSQCTAVYFCEEGCGRKEEHKAWCHRLGRYMKREAQLADLPFSYTPEVTSRNFSLEDFLSAHKLDRGYWLHWSMLLRLQPQIMPAEEEEIGQEQDWIQSHSKAYGPLKDEEAILMSTTNSNNLKKPLVSWRKYFKWRGLSLSSVVAPLLSSALSIYYIITSLVPKHYFNILTKQSLKIHLIESYRELHTLATLWELTVLLPHITFDLVFVCANLPSWCHNMKLYMHKMDEDGSVTIAAEQPENSGMKTVGVKVHCGEYESLQDHEPDLIIGFRPSFLRNASTWHSILPKLQSVGVPAYFCEISEYRCTNSEEVVSTAIRGTVSKPILNPFHCPLRITGGDNKLPKYNNAFIFHLILTPSQEEVVPVLSGEKGNEKNK